MKDPRDVILRPVVSEKSYALTETGAYTFKVHPDASKPEIKLAVEALFSVKVADVRTQNRRGKARRHRLKVGRMRNWKKAIVWTGRSRRSSARS